MDSLKLLLGTLEDLTGKDLKKFQLFLTEGALEGFERIPKGKLEKCDPTDTAGIMREAYGSDGALRITLLILREMNLNDLADKLQRNIENCGPGVSVNMDKDYEDAYLHKVKEEYRDKLKKSSQCFHDWFQDRTNKPLLSKIYTELYITEGGHKGISKDEICSTKIQTKFQKMNENKINYNDIFKCSVDHGRIRTVMTTGIAGIGKTVCVQKFILDWAEGRANQDVDFMFSIPLRKLNLMEDHPYTIPEFLLHFHPELKEVVINPNVLKILRIVLIFDGLDEGKLPLEHKTDIHDPLKAVPLDVLITNLFRGNLLPEALIWITSRPAAVQRIRSFICIDKWTELHGFNDEQKDEYFRNKIGDPAVADKVITHIKRSKTLYIMCQIPVFCWFLATVILTKSGKNTQKLPQTLTEFYIKFLLIETRRKAQKHGKPCEAENKKLLKDNRQAILKLSKLAYNELLKGSIVFSKDSLEESGIDIEDLLYSGMCTELFLGEDVFDKQKYFCFVHLSIQEFLAAVYAFCSFVNGDMEALKLFASQKDEDKTTSMLSLTPETTQNLPEKKENLRPTKETEDSNRLLSIICPCWRNKRDPLEEISLDISTTVDSQLLKHKQINMADFLQNAVDESIKRTNGQLDLFLRFLLGISLESNQKRLQGLLEETKTSADSIKKTAQYIREIISKENNSSEKPERLINLLLCLLEINDNCLHEDIKNFISSGESLSPVKCSELAYMFLVFEETLNVFDLTKYNTTNEGRKRLLSVLRLCRKALLVGCGLEKDSCEAITSAIQSKNSQLRELDLRSNHLKDDGLQLLSAGLKHTNCRLEILRVASCGLSGDSCKILSSVVQSENSALRELDLAYNHLEDHGVELLSPGLKHSNCKLETLRLAACELTSSACQTLALALLSSNVPLKEVDLSNNALTDSGAEELCAALQQPSCALEVVRLSGCLISQRGCELIVSALTSNLDSHLNDLDLSYNHLETTGLKMSSQHGVKINVDGSCEHMLKKGMEKYACKLTLDPKTSSSNLFLCENTFSRPATPARSYCKTASQCVSPLSRSKEPLTGRCYWECEWSGAGAEIGVGYESIYSQGWCSGFGSNDKSWSLMCQKSFRSFGSVNCRNKPDSVSSRDEYTACHNSVRTCLSNPSSCSRRVGVYLDREAGTLSFYRVSSDTLTHLHTFYTTFTDEPLYAVFELQCGSSVFLC